MQNLKKILKNKKGFTLVELMVVVAILGILVAVAVPVYNSVTEKAEKNTCLANLRTIDSAIMQASTNDVTVADDDDEWKTKLDEYLADIDSIKCPGTGSYTVKDGVAYCTQHKAAPTTP